MPDYPLPAYSPLIERFVLDRNLVFLNHGSFGAVPREVLHEQEAIRRHVELDPVRFFVEELEPLMDAARRAVAAFVGAPADGFAFVANATEGVSTVVRSLDVKPGDVLITGSHEYNACNNALRLAAERSGAAVKTVALPCPIDDERPVIEAIVAAVAAERGRAKLLLLSHVTSPSGVILPVEPIIRRVQEMGVDVLLDSAHAPGFTDLNVAALNPAYCTGNLHKWCCAPKGAAFLAVRHDRLGCVHPLAISHGANSPRIDRSRFRLEFDMIGTRDYSPWLAAPRALGVVGGLMDGWDRLRASCRATAAAGATAVSRAVEKWGEGRLLAPDRMLGAMRAVTIPAPREAAGTGRGVGPARYNDPLQDRLLDRWRLQAPVHSVAFTGGGRQRVVRLSAMAYNTPEQYEYLAHALGTELAAEGC